MKALLFGLFFSSSVFAAPVFHWGYEIYHEDEKTLSCERAIAAGSPGLGRSDIIRSPLKTVECFAQVPEENFSQATRSVECFETGTENKTVSGQVTCGPAQTERSTIIKIQEKSCVGTSKCAEKGYQIRFFCTYKQ